MNDPLTATSGKTAGAQQKLSAQLCFSIYCATLGFNKVYRRALKALNITYPQYLVLTVLGECDSLAMSEISELLKLDSSTLTPMLKRMEEQGLVTRERYARDERRVIISLTPEGAALAVKAEASVPAMVERAAGLTTEENAMLRALLAKLNLSLDASVQKA